MAGNPIALDTSVVVKHLRGLTPHISQQLTEAEELYLHTVALGELLFGLERSGNDPRAKGPLERLLQDVVLIAPDEVRGQAGLPWPGLWHPGGTADHSRGSPSGARALPRYGRWPAENGPPCQHPGGMPEAGN